MSEIALLIGVSSRATQTARDLTTELGANANGRHSTTPLRRIAAGNEKIDRSLRGPSPSARLGMTGIAK